VQKNIFKEKNKIILFLSLLIAFGVILNGCNWFSSGLLNVFNPQAQIIVNYSEISLVENEATIDLEVYSLNEVEFIGNGFNYKYYNKGVLIPELTKTVGAEFYVAPSSTPGSPGPITEITDMPLYFQEVIDYVKMNPFIEEINCTLNLIGTDGAGHNINKSVTFDLPVIQPGTDLEPPNAVINVITETSGIVPFTVQFNAYDSTDNRGIESYQWDFGDGTTSSGVMPPAHTYTAVGNYIVKLTVVDYWGNEDFATVVISVIQAAPPSVDIQVIPNTSGNAPFTVYFDASGTEFETEGGFETASFNWDFGDGSTGIGVTTSHTYTNNGVFPVILTVTDSNGNVGYSSVVMNVGVDVEVNAVINTTPDPPTGIAPLTVGLDASESTTSASGATIVSYTWNYDHGIPEEETLIVPVTTHTYNNEGTYLVQLTVEDTEGNKGYTFVSIDVKYPE
jgi:PKD repeat protein